ncbi:MAG: RNA polymerase sigma factor [Anaerolineae bacterium]|nr:RNA polymerase sigma factor [Anaerolineae bacterium]MCB9109349.1 RNA polymerase sigma factor [Anaerolineales bacterium]
MTTILSDKPVQPSLILPGQATDTEFYAILAAERPRLIRLCTAIIGDADAAEDVTQETLLEAWRSVGSLRDPHALRPWLSGVARNVCARWLRAQGKRAPLVEPRPTEAADSPLEQVAADFDLEVELERDELTLLLDRALALLPPNTRDVLLRTFVADLPYAAIAHELGLSENAVAVRVHRGKLALKKLLKTELRVEAETFGLVQADDVWRETRIWCTHCGRRRLLGRLDAEEFALRCPDCNIEANSYHSQDSVSNYSTLKSFRPALNRFIDKMHPLFLDAMQAGGAVCRSCGEWLPLRQGMPPYAPPSLRHRRGLHIYCSRCDEGSYVSIDGLALHSLAGRDFWRRELRIHTLPAIAIERDGLPALHIPFESVTNNAALDVILRRDTYELLDIFNRETP